MSVYFYRDGKRIASGTFADGMLRVHSDIAESTLDEIERLLQSGRHFGLVEGIEFSLDAGMGNDSEDGYWYGDGTE